MKDFLKLHLPRSTPGKSLLAGIGTALAIGLLSLASSYSEIALLIAPFGATCVLLFAAPAAPFSQPVNVVAGHVMSAAIGLVTAMIFPFGLLTVAIAAGLAVTAMMILRVTHPPAGATALVAASATSWTFLVFPVLSGSLALVIVATLYHRLAGNSYPLAGQK